MNARSFVHPMFLGLWLFAAAASYFLLLHYKGNPGGASSPPELWPREGPISLDATRPTLVMLAHPHCPCTAASIDELASLLSHFPDRISAHVLFLDPDVRPARWERQDLRSRTAAIPGVTVSSDPMGREASRLGAATSGHVLVYGPDGRLLFSGGITPARGHAGANFGLDRLHALLDGAATAASGTPVFGCLLEGPCLPSTKEQH